MRVYKDGAYLLSGAGPGEFDWTPLGTFDPLWTVLGTGDFTADGRDDILWQHSTTGAVGYFRMDGRILDWTELVPSLESGWFMRSIADFDGDRYADIYWDRRDDVHEGYWDINLGRLDGFRSLAGPPAIFQTGFTTGDYAGDGSEDIVWTATVGPPRFFTSSASIIDVLGGLVTGSRALHSYFSTWHLE